LPLSVVEMVPQQCWERHFIMNHGLKQLHRHRLQSQSRWQQSARRHCWLLLFLHFDL